MKGLLRFFLKTTCFYLSEYLFKKVKILKLCICNVIHSVKKTVSTEKWCILFNSSRQNVFSFIVLHHMAVIFGGIFQKFSLKEIYKYF